MIVHKSQIIARRIPIYAVHISHSASMSTNKGAAMSSPAPFLRRKLNGTPAFLLNSGIVAAVAALLVSLLTSALAAERDQ